MERGFEKPCQIPRRNFRHEFRIAESSKKARLFLPQSEDKDCKRCGLDMETFDYQDEEREGEKEGNVIRDGRRQYWIGKRWEKRSRKRIRKEGRSWGRKKKGPFVKEVLRLWSRSGVTDGSDDHDTIVLLWFLRLIGIWQSCTKILSCMEQWIWSEARFNASSAGQDPGFQACSSTKPVLCEHDCRHLCLLLSEVTMREDRGESLGTSMHFARNRIDFCDRRLATWRAPK